MSVATSDTEHINTANTANEFTHVAPGTLVSARTCATTPAPTPRTSRRASGSRGVLEATTAFRDDEQRLVVLRGQRRAVVATKVGTPTGTVPVRIVPSPEIADRIVDQISENVHRQDMHEKELRDGIDQLALVGVTAAQMTKRLAVPRHTVDAALKVVKNPASKARMDTESLSLEDAAIYAELRTTRTP